MFSPETRVMLIHNIQMAATCDFQQFGILSSVREPVEPVQPASF